MKSKLFLIFIFISAVVYWILNPYYRSNDSSISPDKEIIDSTITISFSAVGDIMCHSTQYYYAWVEKDSFDFNPVFNVIGDYLRNKDILIGNLETVLAGESKNYSGYPFFNTPNQIAGALKNAGFDILTTANNHANDMGYGGVLRTIEVLKKNGIIPIGTDTLNSKKENNLFFMKGIKFGMLAYTYGTNYREGKTNPSKYINYIDTLKIKRDINDLRDSGADFTIILFHFGEQYQKNISDYQRKVVDKSIEYGADIILGSHPHIIQQFEQFPADNGSLNTGFVIFSLGNFVSNQRWRYSDGGVIFNFEITKNIFSDSVYVSDINYLPIWVFKGKTDRGNDYIILPAEEYSRRDVYNFLTDADADSMKRSYYDTINQLTSKSTVPKIDNPDFTSK